MRFATAAFAFALAGLLGTTAQAEPNSDYRLVIKEHRFAPAELTIPAGQKIQLLVVNQDSSAEEFESYELNREKVIPGGGQARVWIGPLSPGLYPFFGDFHPKTAQGRLRVE